ncbi:MAG: hypothetical protein AAB738_02605 [Patescibacteria group bacterium]
MKKKDQYPVGRMALASLFGWLAFIAFLVGVSTFFMAHHPWKLGAACFAGALIMIGVHGWLNGKVGNFNLIRFSRTEPMRTRRKW